MCIVSIIALACLHVWQRVYVIGLVAEVSQDRVENKKLTDMVKKSRVEIIELSRLSRIEKIAKEELGMNRNGFENIYTLKLDDDQVREHGLDEVVNSLKKLADNLPVLNESQAETIELFEQDE